MKLKIEIRQIDNGFVLHLFDEDGPSSHDEDVFLQSLEQVLQKIKRWADEAAELEGHGEDEEA